MSWTDEVEELVSFVSDRLDELDDDVTGAAIQRLLMDTLEEVGNVATAADQRDIGFAEGLTDAVMTIAAAFQAHPEFKEEWLP